MFEPSRRSATVLSAVKTGATTTSQWLALATNGFRASAMATDSATVLYIFQFPAITGLRMIMVGVSLSGQPHEGTGPYFQTSSTVRLVSICKRGDTGKFFSGQELERSAAAGRDVCDAIGDSRLSHSGN